MQPYSKGLYEVNVSYLVPAANDPSYLDQIVAICASTTRSRSSTAPSRS